MLCDIYFLCQSDTDLNTFLKSSLFMVPAECTDWVDDLVHFPEILAVHGCVEIIEILPDDLFVESVELCIDIEQHFQQGFRIAVLVIRRVRLHIGFQPADELGDVHTKISSSRTISSALAWMLFIRCAQVMESVAFNASVTPSATCIWEISASLRC